MSDPTVVEFQIKDARRAIDRDLGRLATKGLSADQRKAIREDLKFNFDALRDLKHRWQAAQFPLIHHGNIKAGSSVLTGHVAFASHVRLG